MGRFSQDLSKFVQKTKLAPRLVVQKVVMDLGTSIVQKTPVGDPLTWEMPAPAGYVGGRARGGWQYAKDGPNTENSYAIDPGGSGAIGRIMAGVLTGDAATQHFITNSVPYIGPLEFEGWSKQAPAGMVRISIQEFQKFMADAVRDLPP